MLTSLKPLMEGRALTRAEARGAMHELIDGSASAAQAGAFLAALKVRGETEEELTGFAEALRARGTRVSVGRRPLVDTCGTGGDGAGTFNISTCAAFIAAGAGATVAKHGNRAVSSRCGSADVLEALGVGTGVSAALAARCAREAGLCFLFAPAFHPALRNVAGVRKELGCRTVFNLLGPLANPAGADRQVLGVYDRRLLGTVARTLRRLGSEEAMVVASEDGLDELSLAAPTWVCHLKKGRIREYAVGPQDAGLRRRPARAVSGGGVRDNARILRGVLEGRPGPERDVCVLNAAAALVVSGLARDLRQGAALAAQAVDSGRAVEALERLKRLTGAAHAG